jgi:lipopolysaccharide assembly protein A
MTLFHLTYFIFEKEIVHMKFQWLVLLALLFAVLIAIFAVVNVETVPVDYVFGQAEWPLILVILVSAVLGFLLSGTVAIVRMYSLQRKVNALQKEMTVKETLIATQQNEIAEYQKAGVIPEPMIVTDEKRVE